MKHSDEADKETPMQIKVQDLKNETMKFQHYEQEADLHEQARLICMKDSCTLIWVIWVFFFLQRFKFIQHEVMNSNIQQN